MKKRKIGFFEFTDLSVSEKLLRNPFDIDTNDFRQKGNRRDGVVVRASASQSVDLGFISLVESYQKTLKNGIHSFPAWRSANKG